MYDPFARIRRAAKINDQAELTAACIDAVRAGEAASYVLLVALDRRPTVAEVAALLEQTR